MRRIDPFQTWHCKLEDKLQFVYNMAAKANTKRGILPGYFESLKQTESKERYIENPSKDKIRTKFRVESGLTMSIAGQT